MATTKYFTLGKIFGDVKTRGRGSTPATQQCAKPMKPQSHKMPFKCYQSYIICIETLILPLEYQRCKPPMDPEKT